MKDAKLIRAQALPAADAANSTASIDLGAKPWPTTETVHVQVSIPATPALVEAKTITLTIEDSADDSSFAAVTGLSTLVVTGAAEAAGGAAAVRKVILPPGVRRYLRATAAVEDAGGVNTGVSYTLELIF